VLKFQQVVRVFTSAVVCLALAPDVPAAGQVVTVLTRPVPNGEYAATSLLMDGLMACDAARALKPELFVPLGVRFLSGKPVPGNYRLARPFALTRGISLLRVRYQRGKGEQYDIPVEQITYVFNAPIEGLRAGFEARAKIVMNPSDAARGVWYDFNEEDGWKFTNEFSCVRALK